MSDLTIYKYDLQIADEQILEIPEGFEILTVQTQRNRPRLWVIVDPSKGHKSVLIHMRGTGHLMGNAVGKKYIGTFQIDEGTFVFHTFYSP